MIWWDFSNQEFVTLFSIIILSFILLAATISTFIVTDKFQKNKVGDINHANNTLRVYIIDFKNNNVIFFSRFSLKDKQKMTLSQFYLHFAQEDVDKLKSWLYSICVENRVVDDYLEVDMVNPKGKTKYYSILKRIKYNQEDGLLHLESHLMRYISPSTETKKNVKRGIIYGQVTKSEIADIIQKQASLTGFTFCIRFFYKSTQLINQDHVERVLVANLKDVVYCYVHNSAKPCQILDEPGNEIFLFDLSLNNVEKAVQVSANLSNELKKTIAILGYKDSVSYAIGVIDNSQYYQDFGAIYKTSQQACIYAQQNNLNSYFYTRSSKIILNETGKYSQEISRLLKPNALRYLFRPIVYAVKGEPIGYFSYVKSPESPFANYMEMSKYSAKVHRNKEFFAYVSKKIISCFIFEKPNNRSKLYMQISLNDIVFAYEILDQIPDLDKCPLVLVISERDFDEEDLSIDYLKPYFQELKSHGIELCLEMNDERLLLDPAVYTSFDYFIVGSSMVKELKKNKVIQLSIRNLVEQLLKYKKPIIASDMEGWASIELIVKSGITYLSSETISPSNEMILPLDSKKIEKLVTIASNYK